MRSLSRPKISWFLAGALVSGLAACSSGSGDNTVPPPPPAAAGGAGGSRGGGTGGGSPSGSGGTGGSSTAGTGGGSSTGGAGGGTPGTGGASGNKDGGGGAKDGGSPGPDTGAPPAAGDWMGYPGVRDLSQVEPTEGCGKTADIEPGMFKPFMIRGIPTPAGQRDNPGTGNRKYFVRLPPNYDANKKYKVVIAASSCTGGDQNLRAMGDVGTVTDRTGGAIIISPVVEPGVWDADQCYDDKDPNSIEHPFLERFLAEVGSKYCYDKNKVFVQGHSSGGWYSNMIGCVHASELIRAASSNGGGIPDDSAERPKCNSKPMPGLWIFPLRDDEQPQSAKRAVSRALVVNKCDGAGTNPADETVWMKAPSVAWNEGGGVACKKYMCPEAFPVVFCQPPNTHMDLPWHSDAAWALFNSLP